MFKTKYNKYIINNKDSYLSKNVGPIDLRVGSAGSKPSGQ